MPCGIHVLIFPWIILFKTVAGKMRTGGWETAALEKGRQDRMSAGKERYIGWESVKEKAQNN